MLSFDSIRNIHYISLFNVIDVIKKKERVVTIATTLFLLLPTFAYSKTIDL